MNNTTKEFYKNQISTSINSSGWLNVTILNSAIDSIGITSSILNYPITKVQSIQLGESSQLSFLLSKKVDDIMIATSPKSIEILSKLVSLN